MTILCIPDLHAPYQHPDSLTFLTALKKKYKPTEVVCLGDEIDCHALSRFPKDPDGFSAGHELTQAKKFLAKLFPIFPKVKVCNSNHTARPLRRAFEAGIPGALLRTYNEFLNAPSGWSWADSWEVDGIRFEHGEGLSGANGAINGAKLNMQSTVIGHLHSYAGISYLSTPSKQIFAMNVGCLIDVGSYSFAYGKHMKTKPTLGAGVIIDGIPHWIPL